MGDDVTSIKVGETRNGTVDNSSIQVSVIDIAKTTQFYSHKTASMQYRENINKIDSQSVFCSGS